MIDATQSEKLLAALAAGRADTPAIARRLGISMRDLAAWAREPGNLEDLAALAALEEARAAIRIARARRRGAMALERLAGPAKRGGAESEETRRKACVDLLRAEAGAVTPRIRALSPGAVASALATGEARKGGKRCSSPLLSSPIEAMGEVGDPRADDERFGGDEPADAAALRALMVEVSERMAPGARGAAEPGGAAAREDYHDDESGFA